MTDKDDLKRYEATEAKAIVDLLKKVARLRSEGEGAPPHFQAKVLARIEQMAAERKNETETPSFVERLEAKQRKITATYKGIRALGAAFNPPPKFAMVYRKRETEPKVSGAPAVEPRLTIAIDWVPVDLRVEKDLEGGYRLVLKHQREAPQTAPAVTLDIDEKPIALHEVVYRKPLLHLVFRAEIEPEATICEVSVKETGEGPIAVRLSRRGE